MAQPPDTTAVKKPVAPAPTVITPPTAPPPALSPQQKNDWNSFIDFMDKSGMKGNASLDDHNKQIGQYMFQKYKSMNPTSTLTYNDVPRVQAELQNYRSNLVDQYKKGLIKPDSTVKTEADIMPNLSSVDGWLGSKTSSHKFPVAVATSNNNGNVKTTNYGTNTLAFDKQHLKQPGQ